MKRLVNLDLHVQGFKYDRGTMASDNHRGFVAHQDLPRWVILGFKFVKHHTRCAGQTLAVHAFWNRYRIDGIVLKSMKNCGNGECRCVAVGSEHTLPVKHERGLDHRELVVMIDEVPHPDLSRHDRFSRTRERRTLHPSHRRCA